MKSHHLLCLLFLFGAAPLYSDAQIKSNSKQPFKDYPEIVDDFNAQKEYYHYYKFDTPIIRFNALNGLNLADVFQFFLSHNTFAAPAVNDQPIFDGIPVVLDLASLAETKLQEDRIVMKVDGLNLSVINYTLPDHSLHAGKVIRRLYVKDGWVTLNTTGIGNNKNVFGYTVNKNTTAMKLLWTTIDKRFADYINEVVNFNKNNAMKAGVKTKFNWGNFMCTFYGEYKSSYFTKTQLKNTSFLIPGSSDLTSIVALHFKGSEVKDKPDAENFYRQYSEKLNRLENLDVIPSAYWLEEKRRVIEIFKSQAAIDILIIKACEDPKVLKSIYSSPKCIRYADALIEKGDKLKEVWKEVSMEHSKEKQSDALLLEYNQFSDSADWYRHAFYTVIEFGWRNTINNYLPHNSNSHDPAVDRNFRKLFTTIQSRCDD